MSTCLLGLSLLLVISSVRSAIVILVLLSLLLTDALVEQMEQRLSRIQDITLI